MTWLTLFCNVGTGVGVGAGVGVGVGDGDGVGVGVGVGPPGLGVGVGLEPGACEKSLAAPPTPPHPVAKAMATMASSTANKGTSDVFFMYVIPGFGPKFVGAPKSHTHPRPSDFVGLDVGLLWRVGSCSGPDRSKHPPRSCTRERLETALGWISGVTSWKCELTSKNPAVRSGVRCSRSAALGRTTGTK